MNRGVAVIMVVAVALMVSAIGAAPAHADTPIAVSRDGRSFTASLARPLFDPRERWVPGDVRSARLWIRNDSGDPADLVVRLDAGDDLRDLVERGWFGLTGDADGRRWSARRDGDTVARLRLEPGEVTGIKLVARFDPAAGNPSQEVSGSFDLALQLSQVSGVSATPAPGAGPTDRDRTGSSEPGHGEGLAGTGGTAVGWLLAGIIAIGAGVRLVRSGRAR